MQNSNTDPTNEQDESDLEFDELLLHEANTTQENASELRAIHGSNVPLFTAERLLLNYKLSINGEAPKSMVVWAASEDSVVFWKFVLPLAQVLGGDKSVVILDQDSVDFNIDPKTQFALVTLDAEKMTGEFLKKLVRGEGPLSSLLISQTTHSLFYLHSIHRCREAIHPLVSLLVDTDYYKHERPHAHVIVSGVYGSPNSSKAVTSHVNVRSTVCGIE